MTRRKQHGTPVVSTLINVDGKEYRVATTGSHILLIAVRYPASGERLLEHTGRRFKRVARHYLKVVTNA